MYSATVGNKNYFITVITGVKLKKKMNAPPPTLPLTKSWEVLFPNQSIKLGTSDRR